MDTTTPRTLGQEGEYVAFPHGCSAGGCLSSCHVTFQGHDIFGVWKAWNWRLI